jgi:hypothetical protein
VIARVGREHDVATQLLAERRDDGQQQFRFRARAMRLRIDDDLMRRIDRRHTRIPLDHPFTLRHFRTVVVRAIALALGPFGPATLVGMRGQPRTHLVRIALSPFESMDRFLRWRLARRRIRRAMPLNHRARRQFQFGRLFFKVRPRPAPLLRRVARQFHAVDRRHLATNQAFRVAHREHAREHLRDILAQRADEARDRGKVRRLLATQRHERDVLLARALNTPTAHDALRVGEQHDLGQHPGGYAGAPVSSLR